MPYEPQYGPADISKAATDVVAGTGVSLRDYAPLFGGLIVYKAAKKITRRRRRKKNPKSILSYLGL